MKYLVYSAHKSETRAMKEIQDDYLYWDKVKYKYLKTYINKKQSEVFQAANLMKMEGVNERMAQLIKLLNDAPERIFSSEEFNVSNFTARDKI